MSIKKLDIVGFGPGNMEGMTIKAKNALSDCDVIVGFSTYVNLVSGYFPDKEFVKTPMGGEVERVDKALDLAASGKKVCLVCSGDSSVYGMAGLAFELSTNYPDVEVNAIPGVTAALSGSALLGAAVGNDLCLISLSDYHTTREEIELRLKTVAKADFVIALYNPASKARPDYLKDACRVLMEVIPKDRVCGVAESIGREGERASILTLEELMSFPAGMFSTVFIGNSKTKIINGKMVTPRGYKIG